MAAGSYTLTITGTFGSLAHTTQVSIIETVPQKVWDVGSPIPGGMLTGPADNSVVDPALPSTSRHGRHEIWLEATMTPLKPYLLYVVPVTVGTGKNEMALWFVMKSALTAPVQK